MELLRTVNELSDWRAAVQGGAPLGFVPTMGALHAGHLTLVQHSVAENAATLVSIFVNPTQFNDPQDCATYPTPLEADLQQCRAGGVAAVFMPGYADMYPDNFRYSVQEKGVSEMLEGRYRPGHFNGMLTVVLKLLLLARADVAYFGEKDWQQLALVRDLAQAFFVPTQIRPVPTVREPDGLAMSSRNVRLSPEARSRAPLLATALRESATCAEARAALESAGFAVEYVEEWDGRRLAAVQLGGVRLIDNISLAAIGSQRPANASVTLQDVR